ncbi:MAG: hypothetical protein RLZZ156_1430 [Deinococcota bacterium]|jgi:hypothetical protein
MERRSHALRLYLADLHNSLETGLGHDLAPVRLLVLSEADWRSASPYPYGFTFFRRLKNGSGLIFAPADYPANLLWVFKALLVKAESKPKTSLEMFLDLTLGHELGHAIADQIGLRTHVKWLDEFLATYLYLVALKNTMPEALQAALEWGRVLSGTNLECALADMALLKPSGSRSQKRRVAKQADTTVPRHDLGAFEYPLVRLPLANQAWYQARFTLFAAELLEAHGFDFIEAALEVLPKAKGRGAIAKALVRLEPSFKAWFASFGS